MRNGRAPGLSSMFFTFAYNFVLLFGPVQTSCVSLCSAAACADYVCVVGRQPRDTPPLTHIHEFVYTLGNIHGTHARTHARMSNTAGLWREKELGRVKNSYTQRLFHAVPSCRSINVRLRKPLSGPGKSDPALCAIICQRNGRRHTNRACHNFAQLRPKFAAKFSVEPQNHRYQ